MNMFTMKKYKLLCTDCLNVLYTFFILKTQTLKSDSLRDVILEASHGLVYQDEAPYLVCTWRKMKINHYFTTVPMGMVKETK